MAYRETRHCDGGPSSLSQSPESAVGGAYMTRTGRGRKNCRETASLASGEILSPLHLGMQAGGESGAQGHPSVHEREHPQAHILCGSMQEALASNPNTKSNICRIFIQEQTSVYEFKSGRKKNFIQNLWCTCKGLERKLSRELARFGALEDKG